MKKELTVISKELEDGGRNLLGVSLLTELEKENIMNEEEGLLLEKLTHIQRLTNNRENVSFSREVKPVVLLHRGFLNAFTDYSQLRMTSLFIQTVLDPNTNKIVYMFEDKALALSAVQNEDMISLNKVDLGTAYVIVDREALETALLRDISIGKESVIHFNLFEMPDSYEFTYESSKSFIENVNDIIDTIEGNTFEDDENFSQEECDNKGDEE